MSECLEYTAWEGMHFFGNACIILFSYCGSIGIRVYSCGIGTSAMRSVSKEVPVSQITNACAAGHCNRCVVVAIV